MFGKIISLIFIVLFVFLNYYFKKVIFSNRIFLRFCFIYIYIYIYIYS